MSGNNGQGPGLGNNFKKLGNTTGAGINSSMGSGILDKIKKEPIPYVFYILIFLLVLSFSIVTGLAFDKKNKVKDNDRKNLKIASLSLGIITLLVVVAYFVYIYFKNKPSRI